MPKLEIRSGKAAGQVVELDSSTITLGNRRNATVELKDPWVSFNHAKITREGDRFFLVDLRSKSGTWLNQKRVEGSPVALASGDRILLGKTEIQFHSDAAPAGQASTGGSSATGPSASAAPAPAVPVELLERVASLERELAHAQKDAKNLRDAHVAREKLLAETTGKLRALEGRAVTAEKALESARADVARAEARAAAPPPPPPPPAPSAAGGPDLARWRAAYDELRARYDDVVVKGKARIEDLTHRLEAAVKAHAPAPAPAPTGLADEERAALVKKYEGEIKGFESALEERNKDVERLEADVERLEAEAERIRADVERVHSGPEGTQAAAPASGSPAASSNDTETAQLRQELAEKSKRIDELTRINADLRSQLEEINQDMLAQEEELRGEISQLERKLHEATQTGTSPG